MAAPRRLFCSFLAPGNNRVMSILKRSACQLILYTNSLVLTYKKLAAGMLTAKSYLQGCLQVRVFVLTHLGHLVLHWRRLGQLRFMGEHRTRDVAGSTYRLPGLPAAQRGHTCGRTCAR